MTRGGTSSRTARSSTTGSGRRSATTPRTTAATAAWTTSCSGASVQLMRAGLVPDIDVYDSAAWCAPVPLSVMSLRDDGRPVAVPDFTRGAPGSNLRPGLDSRRHRHAPALTRKFSRPAGTKLRPAPGAGPGSASTGSASYLSVGSTWVGSSTRRRKVRVRSCCGLPITSAGGPCSTMTPPSMKTTRSATSRAKAISWVTTSIVMPSRASLRITVRTSPTSSGSSAEVGSSNSISAGSIDSARAIATRCCWPPDSWAG